MRDDRAHRRGVVALAKLGVLVSLVAAGFVLNRGLAMAVYGTSPPVKLALWDASADCPGHLPGTGAVTAMHGVYDIDSLIRDTLAGEVYTWWSVEGLRANAVAARGVATYFYAIHPEYQDMYCNNIPEHYHLSTRQFQGWNPGEMAQEVDDDNRPGDRVTDTVLQALVPPSGTAVYYPWRGPTGEVPREQNALENAAGSYPQRLATVYPGLTVLRIDQFDPTVHVAPPFPSMTNGTHMGAYPADPVPGDYWDQSVTPVGSAREAEAYWGLKHVDVAQDSPFAQPGRYMVAAHMGDMIEFPLMIGGSYSQLQLVGIADRPAPVTVNVFVDGYWKTQGSWTAGSNLRAILTIPVGGVAYGAHAVAIQFTNDTWSPGGGDDGDRNLYLDVVGVSQ